MDFSITVLPPAVYAVAQERSVMTTARATLAAALTCVGLGLVVSPTIAVLGIIAIFTLGAPFIVQSS